MTSINQKFKIFENTKFKEYAVSLEQNAFQIFRHVWKNEKEKVMPKQMKICFCQFVEVTRFIIRR